MSALTGKMVAGFELLDELGRGGMGVVYKARQLSLDRIVAIKFLPAALAKDERKVQRFIREARAAGKLSHPNIVTAYDVGQTNGVYYIAMEYVDGQTAHQALKHRGALTEDEVIDIGIQAAQALGAAHAAGILHRDVKPDNFLMDSSGTLKLADLGLARFEDDGANDGHLTQDGTAMGTPHYMSPEAARGGKLDARSDLYSLGASLYLLASNLTPFTAPTTAAILVKVISEEPRSLRQSAPHLSASLVAVIEKLMHKDPAKRLQSADEVVSALKKVKSGPRVPVGTARQAAWKPSVMPDAEPKGATPAMFAMLGGGLAVVVLGFIIYAMRQPVDPEPKNNVPVAQVDPAKEKPGPALTTGVPDTPKTDPSASETKKFEPEHVITARRAFEKLASEHHSRINRDPIQLTEEWEKLIRQHPNALFIDRARHMAAEARVAADTRQKDWQATKDRATEAGAKNDVKAVVAAYLDFIGRNPDTVEAREAEAAVKDIREKVLAWIGEQMAKAKAQAEAGDAAGALALLNKLKTDLPPKLYEDAQIAPLLETMRKNQQEKDARQARLLEADTKRMREAHAKAETCITDDAAPFEFAQAVDAFTTAEKLLELDATKAEAKAWAERYARAGKVWDAVRERAKTGFPNELQSLGRYKIPGKVSASETRGLSYTSPNLPAGGQLVPWKDLTPENAVELAKQLNPSRLDLGLLAYAVVATAPALELLDPAKYTNETEQALARGAWDRLKKQGSREQLAQSALEKAQAAKERSDAKAASDAIGAFSAGGPLADTDFARSHGAEITAVKEWSEKTAKSTTQPPSVVAVKPADKTTPETIAELKKLGWDSVEGLWIPNPEKKGSYKVTDGRLVLNETDAAGSVIFKLGPGAQVNLMARNDTSEAGPMVREVLRHVGGEPSTGYGAGVAASGVKTFESFNPQAGGGMRRPPMPPNLRFPVAQRAEWPVNEGLHSLSIQTQGENVTVEFDRQYHRSIPRVRAQGNFVLEIQGTAEIHLPQAKKL